MPPIIYRPSSRSGNSSGVSIFTTALNSITNGSTVESSTISNDTEQDTFADFELLIGHGSAPAADREWRLFAIPTLDATNFAYYTAARMPMDYYLGSFMMNNETTARRYVLGEVRMPRRDFKLVLLNDTAQTSASSGNVLLGYFFNLGTS